jgi:predicted nucleic acid-binding protein
MKLLFVDSDILLDSILAREPFFDAATNLLALAEQQNFKFCTSVHSLLNVHYLSKKHFGELLTRQSIQALTELIDIIPEDITLIQQALTSEFSDFEDGVQYFAAISAKADFIITRNTKDYKHSAISVLTAEQFLLNTL